MNTENSKTSESNKFFMTLPIRLISKIKKKILH